MRIIEEVLNGHEPSPKEVRRYIDEWNGLPDYVAQEHALDKLFCEVCKDNRSMDNILIKCSALNDFYSTNIFKIYNVAMHFINQDIDGRLAEEDMSLVNDLAKVTMDGRTFNFYSFASKYCSHHHPEAYPIYDFYVDWLLRYFNGKDKFYTSKPMNLKNYSTFVEVIKAFRKHYGLEDFTIKQIDHYLWKFGKDVIVRYEKKKN